MTADKKAFNARLFLFAFIRANTIDFKLDKVASNFMTFQTRRVKITTSVYTDADYDKIKSLLRMR